MIVYRLFHLCNPDARQNTGNRKHLSSFDSDHYPENFEAFLSALKPFCDDLEDKDNEAEAREIPDRLEKLTDSMPRREQKTASDEINRVLALFFTPALVKQGDGGKIFAETFCGMWNKRYPRNTFQAGDYDKILAGFDSNFLGITLRNSKKK